MVATLALPIFLALYGSSDLHVTVVPPPMKQDSSDVSFKLKQIPHNRNACRQEAPFALSVEMNSDHTQIGIIISLTDRLGTGEEYLSVNNCSGVATFGDRSSATLFVPQFEDRATEEREGIESCKGFFLLTNCATGPRLLHTTDRENPYFAVYANKPLPDSDVVLGRRRICPTLSD